jgi:peptide/nickel transport system substrate-binding protein
MSVRRIHLGICLLTVAILLLGACAPAPAPTAAPAAAPTNAPAAAPTSAPAAAPTSASAPTAAKAAKTMTVGFWQEPPVLVAQWNSMNVLNLITKMHNPGFWVLNDSEVPIPAVAEAIPNKDNGGLSADGKTITIKLKKNVKWTDGVAFTAKDAVFTWQTVMTVYSLKWF